jgi:Ser/Thr protein kinase RdoA (MazF antagonist)
MAIFPTQYSTLSAAALGKHVEEQYGLNGLQCRFLLRGVSDTYVLEGAVEKYILKIYRDAHRSLEEIKGELELLNTLHRAGCKVSYPISDKTGNQLQAFEAAEGTRYGILFSYAQGNPAYKPTDDQLTITGQEMARIHNITAAITLHHPRATYNHHTTLLHPIKILEPAFTELSDEYRYLQETAAAVIKKLDSIDTSGFSYGYCHYDFMPKNFHFDEHNNITFFDFDFAGKGFLVNDLMSYWIHYALYFVVGRISREEADRAFNQFVDAYRTVRPVSAAEIDAIPYLNFTFWVFYLGFYQEQFDDFSTHFFNNHFKKERVALMKKIMDAFCLL